MLREIRVYGRLAKFLGRRTFTAAVDSVADAMRFLLANFPELEGHMSDQHYRVSVGTYDLSEEELEHPVGKQVIKIAPVVAGAGAVGRIIAGVALVAFAIAGGAGVFGLAFAKNVGLFGIVGGVGASLALGGVAQLLTPTPTLSPTAGNAYTQQTTRETELDPQKSYSFSGIQNTSRAGTPVPLIYGETIVGSVVISAGIDTEQVTV
jgi:predicted phage tail protein